MRPLAVINGMLLGTIGAIFIGLAVVTFIFLLLGSDNPILRDELPALWVNTAGFGVLAAISALAFIGQLKTTAWRWYAEIGLLLGLLGMVAHFLY